jgi:hypothetical protein
MNMVNQRGTETAYATATVSLPSKSGGMAVIKTAPVDIQREAAQMFARHNELLAAKRRKG